MSEGWVGRSFVIALNGEPIAAVRTKSVSRTKQPIDITEGEQDGWRHILDIPDGFSVEVSVEGVATAANYQVLRDQWYGNTFSEVEIRHPDGSIETPVDGAFLNALTQGGEYNGAVSFQASFSFSGALTGNRVAPVLNATQYAENVRLVWSPATVPDSPVDVYEIFRRVNAGEFELLDQVGADAVTYLDESEYEDGDVVTYYVVAYGQVSSALESNRDTVTYATFAGIIAGVAPPSVDPEDFELIGYSDNQSLWPFEGPDFGARFGDMLPGFTVRGVVDDIIDGNFRLFLWRAGATPIPADAFDSITINGEVFLRAAAIENDAVDLGANQGRELRWATLAGLLNAEAYRVEFT